MATVWLRKPQKQFSGGPKLAKKSKYGNTKIENQFGTFDSKHEWERYQKLWLKQRAGLISNLRRQVVFELVPAVKFEGEERAKPAIRYIADFVYDDAGGHEVIEDAKGVRDKVYRIKKHLMKAFLQKEIVEV